jgi:hypothetical protein
MSTSAEIKDAKHFKEQLRVLRAQQVNTVKRVEEARAKYGHETEGTWAEYLVDIEKRASENLTDIRTSIEKVKAVLATKAHIPTKDEARKTRQDAAKNGRR